MGAFKQNQSDKEHMKSLTVRNSSAACLTLLLERKKEGNIKKKKKWGTSESKQDPKVELDTETLLSSVLGDQRKPWKTSEDDLVISVLLCLESTPQLSGKPHKDFTANFIWSF